MTVTDAWQYIYEHAVIDPDDLTDENGVELDYDARSKLHEHFEQALAIVHVHMGHRRASTVGEPS